MDAIKLIKVGFDTLENRDPIYEIEMGVFVDDNSLTAHGKIAKWFNEHEPVKMYLGWDGQVYPKFKMEPCKIL